MMEGPSFGVLIISLPGLEFKRVDTSRGTDVTGGFLYRVK